jgi:ABC-type multidrug transport system fused ATPase/permease subunit
MDTIAAFALGVVALIVVADRTRVSIGDTGLALTYAISLASSVQLLVRSWCEVEVGFDSLAGLLQFKSIPQEAPLVVERWLKPPEGWPSKGKVCIKDLVVRCGGSKQASSTGAGGNAGSGMLGAGSGSGQGGSLASSAPSTPKVSVSLNRINFETRRMEKFGVLGKSRRSRRALVASLARLVEPESGFVKIDNVDIGLIGLADLRTALSLIPANPYLFPGSIRENVDPRGAASDQDIWNALARSRVDALIRALPGGLDYMISPVSVFLLWYTPGFFFLPLIISG